jgi:hypothetical protein
VFAGPALRLAVEDAVLVAVEREALAAAGVHVGEGDRLTGGAREGAQIRRGDHAALVVAERGGGGGVEEEAALAAVDDGLGDQLALSGLGAADQRERRGGALLEEVDAGRCVGAALGGQRDLLADDRGDVWSGTR